MVSEEHIRSARTTSELLDISREIAELPEAEKSGLRGDICAALLRRLEELRSDEPTASGR